MIIRPVLMIELNTIAIAQVITVETTSIVMGYASKNLESEDGLC
jgi:hypothetical protein